MPKYKCNNNSCKSYNKTETVLKVNLKIIGEKVICREAICPSCGKERESIDNNGFGSAFFGHKDICRK